MLLNYKRYEEVPSVYPSAPEGLSTEAAAIDASVIWARIEAWIAYRWKERDVRWAVENEGYGTQYWEADLTPVTLTTAERFTGTEWIEITPDSASFNGYAISSAGLFRFSGTAGEDEVPPKPVLEAYRRLAEYLADESVVPAGASRASVRAGSVSLNVTRDPNWKGHALQASGAADLLRPYRRAHVV
ncbi:hypothetical protein [Hyphomonas oceanitis]|uniref:Uncharacterized protein n=1 Tax=Hyphomonas oceanitis SCH89 TaxID=1280953 RepID=A0A059G888_9PROT|nr:hypothetical protein [Hyphomonas oceanitis]KDA03067.1 hypothetical protein HOC_07819 [Hyphomonas oceanitis SCH89]